MYVITTTEQRPEEREPIFTIDGTEYTIVKEVGGEVALEAMERARYENDAAVTAWCVEQCIGKEAWKALRAVKGLDPAVVRGIMAVCREKVFAATEEEGKG